MEEDFGFKIIRKKVPPEGQEWLERREDEKNSESGSSVRDIFGFNLLNVWEFKKQPNRIPEIKKFHEELFESALRVVQKQMIEVAKKHPKSFKKLLLNYFSQAESVVLESLKEQFGYNTKEGKADLETEIDDLVLDNPGIPREILERNFIIHEIVAVVQESYLEDDPILKENTLIPMLQNHTKETMAVEKEMQKDIIQYIERIKLLLAVAIEQSKLPINQKLVEERLVTLEFRVVDGITANLAEAWGDFQASKHRIRLSTYAPKDKWWPIFVHEIMHALSGQIENIETTDPYEPYLTIYDQIKIGFLFSNRRNELENKDKDIKQSSFNWLNEALTEEATIDLIKDKSLTYKNERKLLHMLIEKGVPKEQFYAAYFENYDATKPTGEHKLPQTKQLFNFTNSKFGTGFLLNLDKFIEKSGAFEAIKSWEIHNDKFPQYLRDLATKGHS